MRRACSKARCETPAPAPAPTPVSSHVRPSQSVPSKAACSRTSPFPYGVNTQMPVGVMAPSLLCPLLLFPARGLTSVSVAVGLWGMVRAF